MIKQVKKGEFEITCDICGKPITHSNKYGMFCDDECGNTNVGKLAINSVEILFSAFEKLDKIFKS